MRSYFVGSGITSVSPGTGDFNFAVLEGYMIRDGKIAEPVRGATLIGYAGTLEFDWYTDELKVHLHHTPRVETHKIDSKAMSHGGGDLVLPPAGAGRAWSGLAVLESSRWTSWQRISPAGAAALAAVPAPPASGGPRPFCKGRRS